MDPPFLFLVLPWILFRIGNSWRSPQGPCPSFIAGLIIIRVASWVTCEKDNLLDCYRDGSEWPQLMSEPSASQHTASKVPSIIITFFFFDYFHSDVERERRQTFYFYFSDLSISAGCAVQRCRVRPGSFGERSTSIHFSMCQIGLRQT